jgi:N-acetylglucosaminyl-diphospho-decaprenol L-rhamnosyltransferase
VSFTAVVVLHDSARDVALLLDSLRDHVLPHGDVQVVCVDSGSRDDGAAVAAARGADVVALDGNPGFGAANNAGVARARHDVSVLLNPDVVALDGALHALAALAGARDALHVPRLLNPDGSVQRSAHPVPGRAAALLPALVHPRLLPRGPREAADPWRSGTDREVGWAIAAVLAARTATLRALGPFDPSAFLFYEDLELGLRARAAGVPTILHPALRLLHAGQHSTAPALGTAHELQARRRREVVGAALGPRALALDDAAQGLTFATRAAARAVLRRDGSRPRAQLAALRAARRAPRG